MNQGKVEVVKQEMARVNVDILGISASLKTLKTQIDGKTSHTQIESDQTRDGKSEHRHFRNQQTKMDWNV